MGNGISLSIWLGKNWATGDIFCSLLFHCDPIAHGYLPPTTPRAPLLFFFPLNMHQPQKKLVLVFTTQYHFQPMVCLHQDPYTLQKQKAFSSCYGDFKCKQVDAGDTGEAAGLWEVVSEVGSQSST